MQHPLVIVFESGDHLANCLRVNGVNRSCVIREVKSVDEFRAAAPAGAAAIGIVYLDAKKGGWDALSWLGESRPCAAAVAVLDAAVAGNATVAWDLGARHVVTPERSASELPAVVASLLSSTWGEPYETTIADRGSAAVR